MRSSVLVAVLLAGHAGAAEPTLGLARAQLKELKYADAARTLAQLAGAEGFTRAEALEFFTLEGRVKAALSDAAGAKTAFSQAALLDPELKLPGRVGPRVSTPFLEAKAWAREHGPLALAPPAQPTRDGERWALDFKPPGDLGVLIAEVVFTCLEDGVSREVRVPAAALGRLEGRGQKVTVSWHLLTAHRWALGDGGPVAIPTPTFGAPPPVSAHPLPSVADAVAAIAAVPVVPEPPPDHGRALMPLGIVAMALGTTGTIIGSLDLSGAGAAAQRARTANTLEALNSELAYGRSAQTAGAVFLTVGSVLVAGGAALVVYRVVSSAARVSVAPTPGGVVVAGTFP